VDVDISFALVAIQMIQNPTDSTGFVDIGGIELGKPFVIQGDAATSKRLAEHIANPELASVSFGCCYRSVMIIDAAVGSTSILGLQVHEVDETDGTPRSSLDLEVRLEFCAESGREGGDAVHPRWNDQTALLLA
jgi:hypothetical protein